jgi:hypothetical protein
VLILRLKPAIMESEETAVARQRFGRYIPAETNTHSAIEELLDAVFSMRSLPKPNLNL